MMSSSIESETTLKPVRMRFTPEEDAMIKDLVENKKISPWSEVAKYLPGRTGNQCRDRYNSYLYANTSSKSWTIEEDKMIVEKYKEFGPRWVLISKFIPGRNGNSIKNRWHKALVKYHGIKHNNVKQERRNKNLKYCLNCPATQPVNNEDINFLIDQLVKNIPDDSEMNIDLDSCFSEFYAENLDFPAFV
ncbi:Myb-like DNA-binding domain containing protein [Trichomonas vaginalis G3]|uniref:Myb-like DNA-binding domain containing protein n=1 Tax=Trichomonas vaginalis (strain ATCC PRA-98 / G3) TaxID=412133 RepID=A2ENQ9_TRIV3|nr:RNA polymerase II transcription regulator recruiting protein [Trichomonas vaginalis G3]EAY05685.1 Myb-like DNA-binding domain containing protein [Trichomonas vaginalis G3]KAI5506855.1 RNA polymerase II transcription regulator recruiting protein [Trichomonas vaginalis G3]|eukprot:XP_001317908.1 Myb-like DNA-binding domain containing protein [Trichomonas vaginalis G3]